MQLNIQSIKKDNYFKSVDLFYDIKQLNKSQIAYAKLYDYNFNNLYNGVKLVIDDKVQISELLIEINKIIKKLGCYYSDLDNTLDFDKRTKEYKELQNNRKACLYILNSLDDVKIKLEDANFICIDI